MNFPKNWNIVLWFSPFSNVSSEIEMSNLTSKIRGFARFKKENLDFIRIADTLRSFQPTWDRVCKVNFYPTLSDWGGWGEG